MIDFLMSESASKTDNEVLDSREVARLIDKRHANLVRDIDGYIRYLRKRQNQKQGYQNPDVDFDDSTLSDQNSNMSFADNSAIRQNADMRCDDFFIESSYDAGTGKPYKCYLVTKMGCEFIAHKMKGEKATQFTAAYINEFHRMKDALQTHTISSAPQPPAVTNQIQALETFFSIVKSQQEKLEEHDCKIQECDAKLELQCAALQELSDKIENFKPREILVPVEQIINTDIGDLTLQISKRDTVSTTQVAQMYGYSAIVFNRLLEKMGIIEPHESKGWQLTADNMARGLGVLEPPTPKCAAYILWTPNGRKFLKAALRQIGITPKKRAIPAKRKRMSRKTALKVVS